MSASKKGVFALVSTMILFIFALNNFAFAAEVNFKTLHVSVKPEFDQEQKIFYNYAGVLENTGDVSVYVPKEIINDQSLQFCAISPQGEHLCQPREKNDEGIYSKYSGNIPQKDFLFEGYAPTIKESNGAKTFQYSFKAAQDVAELNIAIVEPKGASDFKINPSAQSTAADNDGLNNNNYSYKNVKKGKEYKFDVSYKKDGWEVSVVNPEKSGQPAATASGGGGVSGLTVIGAIIAALLVAGGALFAFTKWSGQGGSGSGRPAPAAPKGKSHFCTNCGTRIVGGKFCPNCGAKT